LDLLAAEQFVAQPTLLVHGDIALNYGTEYGTGIPSPCPLRKKPEAAP
jgi:hypothetical protein